MAGGYRGGAPRPGDHGQKSGGSNNGGPARSGAAGGGATRPGGAPRPGNHGQASSPASTEREYRGGAPRPGDRGQVPADAPSKKGNQDRVASGSENLPTGVTPLNQPKPMGATPFVSDPSLGQVMGEIISAALSTVVPGAGVANSVAGSVAGGTLGDFSAISRGGIIGQGIDAVTGGVPGQQTGWSADRNHGVPGPIGGTGGAVNGGPIGPVHAGRVERDGTSGGTPVSEALRVILSQAGVWPPVKASAV
jgi:hypothetical protein